jgi:hypothetical protein
MILLYALLIVLQESLISSLPQKDARARLKGRRDLFKDRAVNPTTLTRRRKN